MQRERAWTLATLAALLGIVAACYWPGLTGGFVFDDFPNIVDNTALRVGFGSDWPHWLAAMFSSPSSDLQRPLAMLSFAINQAATGLDPYWMKLTNIGVHLLNTVLVFCLVRFLVRAAKSRDFPGPFDDRLPLWVAAAWALNPINVMAVLYIVQRMESLSHTFVFGGLCMYLAGRERMRRDGSGWAMSSAGLVGGTALGMLAKESAALLPLYALALEWALLRFSTGHKIGDRLLTASFAGIAVLAIAALAWELPRALSPMAYAGRDFSLSERLLTEPRVLVEYLQWTLFPGVDRLGLYHDDYAFSQALLLPPSTLSSLLLLAAICGIAIAVRARLPLVALGLAWFFIAHLLTATIIPLELVYEHRNYFASLGLCLALGDALRRLFGKHARTLGLLAIAILGFYATITTLRAREWSDSLQFSINQATRRPQSPRATYDVARTLIILSGYRPESPYVPRAKTALDRAMHVPQATTLPYAAAILFASRLHEPAPAEWWQGLQDKLRQQPTGPQQTSSLASLVDCQLHGPCDLPRQAMVDTFDAALERGPNPEVFNIYGNYALNVLRKPELALRLWRSAASDAPNVMQYQATLARLLIAMGHPDEATPYIARVRGLGRIGQNESVARSIEAMAHPAGAESPGPESVPTR